MFRLGGGGDAREINVALKQRLLQARFKDSAGSFDDITGKREVNASAVFVIIRSALADTRSSHPPPPRCLAERENLPARISPRSLSLLPPRGGTAYSGQVSSPLRDSRANFPCPSPLPGDSPMTIRDCRIVKP